MNRSKQLDLLLQLWYMVFIISMVCCFRAISSIATALLLLTGLLRNKVSTGTWINGRWKNGFILACCLFFLIQALSLWYTGNINESIKSLQIKTALVFIPAALCCCGYINSSTRRRLGGVFIWTLAALMLYCLLHALYSYCFRAAHSDVFFYHALVAPFRQHAVLVSIYLFIGLMLLLERWREAGILHSKRLHVCLVLFFTCCILLLSSKLVIVFSAGCLLYYAVLTFRIKRGNRFILIAVMVTGLALTVLVLLTNNRISQRFNEIISGRISLVEQPAFNPGVYFNGLQFRLLQWRFVKEILTEQHAWLQGVSGNAQELLDKKYISTHMYTGTPGTGNRGYLGYNTHNQFLQSVLTLGIPGLAAFVFICFAMLRMTAGGHNRELAAVVALLVAYCFNEAVLETQYGTMLFTFFPLFLYYGGVRPKHAIPPGTTA